MHTVLKGCVDAYVLKGLCGCIRVKRAVWMLTVTHTVLKGCVYAYSVKGLCGCIHGRCV